jgi:hypothetical protein
MTIVNLAHHLAMRANEIPTPLPSTGCNFINMVSNQFASINSIGSFHQGMQLDLRIVKIKFLLSLSGWKINGSNWYTVPGYGSVCCVVPTGIVDDSPQAAEDTSII